MPETHVNAATRAARWILLLLLTGLLIGRRDFAHWNLGDLWRIFNLTPPTILTYAFVTETTLLLLLPVALIRARNQYERAEGRTRFEKLLTAFGWSSLAALGLIAWGALHAVVAKFNGGDNYLIVRQSALALIYPAAFLYTVVLFSGTAHATQRAVWACVAASLLCALLDTFHLLDPKTTSQLPGTLAEWMPIYGQETLPIAILGLGFCVVALRTWPLRALALAGVLFAGWRQSIRPTQSVVLIGMAFTLAFLFAVGIATAFQKQFATLKRAALCIAFFAIMATGYRALKTFTAQPEQPGTETASEIKAWNLGQYARLFELFDRTQLPANPAERMIAKRPPYVPIDDPEVAKLQAVFDATSVSVRNNVWRFLVWRRMASDWRNGHWLVGAGVGKPWFYRALYQSGFHYGDDREGLDPHNSFLNVLYRYGLTGLTLLLCVICVTMAQAFRALKAANGDVLLEALLLYFCYTLLFAFFTVSLEGPAYSLPFWIALGLIHVRASKLLVPAKESVAVHS